MADESREPAKQEEEKSGEVEVKKAGAEGAEPGAEKRSLSPLWDFDREFERAFENFFTRGWLRSPRWEFPKLSRAFHDKMPNVNVIDRDDEVVVEAEYVQADCFAREGGPLVVPARTLLSQLV